MNLRVSNGADILHIASDNALEVLSRADGNLDGLDGRKMDKSSALIPSDSARKTSSLESTTSDGAGLILP